MNPKAVISKVRKSYKAIFSVITLSMPLSKACRGCIHGMVCQTPNHEISPNWRVVSEHMRNKRLVTTHHAPNSLP